MREKKICDCVSKVQEAIREKEGDPNAEMDLAMTMGVEGFRTYPRLTYTVKVKGKKKPVEKTLIPSYCPFCGKEYPKVN